jgi:hypothetical protein
MNLQGIKKRFAKILVYSITTIIFLLISSFLILQLPGVQRALAKQYLSDFSKVIGFKTTFSSIRFSWFDRLVLDNVVIEDPEHHEMIGVRRLLINYKISTLFEGKDVNIDAIYIDSARVFFTKIGSNRTLNINEFIRQINEQYGSSGKGGGNGRKINIGEAIVSDSKFSYDNTGKDSLAGFDYNHFAIQISEAQLQNFLALGDTVQFNVRTLAAEDHKTKLGIKHLTTFFRISQKSLEFQGVDLQAGQSTISDTIIFNYDSQADLSDFVNKVKINAHLHNTIIHPKDLALFAPAVSKLQLPISVNGNIIGRINNFRFTHMELRTGNSLLQGSINMDGLPDFNETFIVLHLKNSKIDFNDLSFVFNENISKRLTPLGGLSLNGQFLGYPTDFVAKGDFSNGLGRIVSDINLKVNENSFDRSSYKGQISLVNFNLGKYLSDTTLYQKVNLDGRISGSGFTSSTANFTLVSTIQSIGIKGYNYKNIKTDARFSSLFFNGELQIRDPNLQVSAKGSVDLRNNLNQVKIQATLDTINLDKLNIARKKLFLQAKLDVNMSGFTLDSLSGDAQIDNLKLNYNNEWLALNQVTLRARRNNRQRQLLLGSDMINAKAEGDFYFSSLFQDIRTLLNEFYLNIKNDKNSIRDYYVNKIKTPEEYEAAFEVNIKNIKPLSTLFKIDLGLAKGTNIEGKFSSGRTTHIHALTTIDSLQYQNVLLTDTEIEINASKVSDSTQTLAMAYVSSASQQIGTLRTKAFITEAIWDSDHIDFSLNLDQQTQNNNLRLKGEVDFNDSTQIRFLPSSKVQLLEKVWTIDSANQFTVKGKEWGIHMVRWTNNEQSINLHGNISEDPLKSIKLTVQDFNLTTINSLIQRPLSGHVNAEVVMSKVYEQPTLQNIIAIHDLKVNDFLVGNITGNNLWDPEAKKFKVDFDIDRLDKKIVNCEGFYNPSDNESPLSISATLEKANLKIMEPFIDQIFSNIEGTLSGAYSLTGTLQKPLLKGEGQIENGQLMVNYLKTIYQIKGIIGLRQDAIYFENIELTDVFKNKGKLNGEISHVNFRQMQINLNARFDDLQLLNTSARDNSLFYGQGYGSGDVSFKGPINNLIITANATTRKNTRIFIPMAGSSSTERKEFINFVNLTDSTYQAGLQTEIAKKINLTGITFDLNLNVTPAAYCEIIFDIKAGDIIRGRGNGRIKLQLDTKGEFNMFGPVVFTEGAYNFTLYDIINKEFTISPGSSITWYGDPYQGLMKINATYDQLASYAPILNDPDHTLSTVPQIRRKYPVKVLLKLDGPMLSPQIDFDILSKDLPKSIPVEGRPAVRLQDEFLAFKNKLDEQELKRQVFSLIILRKFSPADAFNTSGSLVSSVSELFSNQLSYWMSQVDENLEVNVDLGTMDQEAYNAFQLRLSYTFLNGRLRVTRDGTFGNTGNSNNSNNTGSTSTTENTGNNYSSVIGDWTVDYLLTPDGKFKVKMYSRQNVNPLNTSLNSQNAITTGVSLLYTQSFNELKDLLKASRDKNRRKPEEDPNLNEEATKDEEGHQ